MRLTTRGKRLLIALILVASFCVGMFTPWDSLPWNQAKVELFEDQQGWDCSTQGNRICGESPVTQEANR